MRPAVLVRALPAPAPISRASFSRALILRRARHGGSLSLRPQSRHVSTASATSKLGQTLETMSAGGTSAQSEVQVEQGLRMLVFGKPGSGKGTLSARLVQNFNISFVSTGDVLRKEIASGSDVGKKAEEIVASGGLVSDELMLEIVMTELDRLRGKSWIIDGFPRTLRQGQLLDEVLAREGRPLNMIVHLNVPDGVIMSRIAARWVHLPSGRVYNTTYSAPKVPGKDDVTGEPLSKRPDDTPETFGKRLKAYYESTAPLLEFFAKLYPKSLISLSGSTSDEVLVAAGLRPPSPSSSSPSPSSSSASASRSRPYAAAPPPPRPATPFLAPSYGRSAGRHPSVPVPVPSLMDEAARGAGPSRPRSWSGEGDPLRRPSSAQTWEGVTASVFRLGEAGQQTEEAIRSTVRTFKEDGVDVVFASSSLPSISTSSPSSLPSSSSSSAPPPPPSLPTATNPWDRPHSIIWHLPPSLPHPSAYSGSTSASASDPTAHHPLSHFLPIHLPSSSHPIWPPHSDSPDRPTSTVNYLADLPPLPSHHGLSPNAIDQLWPQLEALVEPYGLRRADVDPKARIGGAQSGEEEAQSGEHVRRKADDLADPADEERRALKGE